MITFTVGLIAFNVINTNELRIIVLISEIACGLRLMKLLLTIILTILWKPVLYFINRSNNPKPIRANKVRLKNYFLIIVEIFETSNYYAL